MQGHKIKIQISKLQHVNNLIEALSENYEKNPYTSQRFRPIEGYAKNQNISLALAFAATIGALGLYSSPTQVFAAALNDPRGDATNPDFDIRGAGVDDNGDPYIRVSGVAGGTTSETEGTIFAYVFITDAGVYAVTSHGGIEDSTEVGNDEQYHAHLVTLDNDNCVTSIEEDGNAGLHNKRVTITGTDATEFNQVLTVELTASDDGICVTEVFDTA